MKSRTFWYSVLVLMVCSLFAVSHAMASENDNPGVSGWFIQDMNNGETVLQPGTTTYCQKDFKVKNMSNDPAEVRVIMGNGANYYDEPLKPGETKSYNLKPESPFSGGWEGAKGVAIHEARIVNATAGSAEVKVLCK
ncbi:MAG: hypothetical protein ACE5E9_07735 [Nitrospinaceae bacterium]